MTGDLLIMMFLSRFSEAVDIGLGLEKAAYFLLVSSHLPQILYSARGTARW
jgi:hypothetical protein